ncbi:dietary restriction down regulated [Caenorhabditis elegans]|uniref:Dietary restriction down regulated n=1 Tax=Caenorhabditis elegans TaxID=6239 RepID=Q20840_CAEEL|nr:dietary restriction down regulated [Caenorhabditis elegans]CCD70892.1 dietary restriction down regulated [Caenorhabditis elegans]|eukprot:NP_509415.2 dietary restriction down regulated [Caenorhabditis elegans]
MLSASTIFAWVAIFGSYVAYKVYNFLIKQRVDNYGKKTVAISGCDSGFGRLLAVRLVKQGVPVIAGVLKKENGESLKKEVNTPSLLTFGILNVANDESVKEFVKLVEKTVENRGLWGVVANAGILGNSGPDDWLSAQDYINTMQVNTFGVMRFIQGLKKFVKKQEGRVVIISSISGRTPRPTVGPYCVSKHAVEAYADVIRHELIDFNVSVHLLEPGFFTTNITQTATNDLDAVWERLDDETKKEYGKEFYDDYKNSRFSRLSHCADDLNPVIDAYDHALLGKYPKTRYWVGWDTILFYIPLATLPTFAQDWFISFQRCSRPVPASMKNHH